MTARSTTCPPCTANCTQGRTCPGRAEALAPARGIVNGLLLSLWLCALAAFLVCVLAGCGGGDPADFAVDKTLQPLNCQATPEQCK